MSRPLPLVLYRLATAALEPLAPVLLRRRAARGKEDAARIGERLGHASLPRPAGPLVWLHGASVGETLSLLPLIDWLRARRPDLSLLVTSGTTTSAQVLARRLPNGAIHQYAPIDAPGALKRFLAHWKPDLAVLVESEIWPNLIGEAKAAGAKLALVSARMTSSSAAGWARAPATAATLVGGFDTVLAQDDASAQRLTALGARDDGRLNLKLAGEPLPVDPAALEAIQAAAGERPILLAASTHDGDEAMALAAYAKADPGHRALLVIAPRHPARAQDVVDLARDEGFTAIKIKPFLDDWHRQPMARMMRSAIGAVEAVREAVGWDIDIAIEMHRNLTPDLAVVFAAAAARISPYFLEDPILPYSVAANASVAGRMAGPVAVAERNTNIWEFREFSDCHAVSILRPDVGLAGGFTQMRKIAAIAESRHQRIVPHNFTAPVSTACHIQLAACTPNWDVQGYVREDRDPWNRVTSHINRIKNGYLIIPDAPGIGMTLDLEYLAGAAYVPFGTKFPDGPVRAADGGIKHQ